MSEKRKAQTVRLTAAITGEMRVEDVPLAPWADLNAIKGEDDDPLEVVVDVPAGKSKRGWNYTPQALQKIVGEVMHQGLPGFLGHQKPENVDTEFPTPVTHWVGAKWENGRAYFRGVIDKAASDLKRWIRGKVIRQVSIYGQPKLQNTAGEINVIDYLPLSIDWTPLNRAGMPTSIVATGEMDAIGGEFDSSEHNGGEEPMNVQELIAKLKEQLQMKNTTMQAIVGEMGWQFQDLAREIGGETYTALQARSNLVGEMAQLLGLDAKASTEEVLKAVKSAREAQINSLKVQQDATIDKVIGEMVVAEQARPLIKRLLNAPENATEDDIKKAVGEMLQQEDVKTLIGGVFKQDVIHPKTPGAQGQTGGLRTRKVSI